MSYFLVTDMVFLDFLYLMEKNHKKDGKEKTLKLQGEIELAQNSVTMSLGKFLENIKRQLKDLSRENRTLNDQTIAVWFTAFYCHKKGDNYWVVSP